jgi:hypothetical protein
MWIGYREGREHWHNRTEETGVYQYVQLLKAVGHDTTIQLFFFETYNISTWLACKQFRKA